MRTIPLIIAVLGVFTAATPGPLVSRPPAQEPSIATPSPDPAALFNHHALRRARLLIEMRLFELRERRLGCVREAIRRRIPPDLLPEAELRDRTGQSEASVKQSGAPSTTVSRSALSESEDCPWLWRVQRRRRLTA